MRAGNRKYLELFAFSSVLTVLIGIAPAAALLGPAVSPADLPGAQSQLIQIERGVSYTLFAGSLLLFLWHIRSKRSSASTANVDEVTALVSNRPPPTSPGRADATLRYIAVSLPALPLLVYLWQYNNLAYASLFLGDQDFTNISVALNATARGDGLLFTPYLSTGPSGSYLGHHFSPALLLLYVPVYWIVNLISDAGGIGRPTHFVYALALWGTLAAGLALWARLFQKEIRSSFGAVLLMALLCGAFPLWRLALSFHYELPVLPLSALFFLSLRNRRQQQTDRTSVWFYISMLLWMSVKEDIALYLILFGAYLCAHRGESPRSSLTLHLARGLTVIVVATAWVAVALWSMDTIGGSERVDWIAIWREPGAPIQQSARPGLLLLLATGGLALLSIRQFVLVLLPILVFHLVSGQIWHHSFLGHYSYAILPFLFFAAMRGWQRFETVTEALFANTTGLTAIAGMFVMGCSFAAAAGDRYMPMPGPAHDADRAEIAKLLQIPESGDCVQTQWHFSAHAPLDLRVYPLMAPENNPAHATMPGPHNFTEFYFNPQESEGPATRCTGAYFLLLDRTRPLPPVYTQEVLNAFADFAMMNLERVNAGAAGSVELYRLRRLD